jgi:hypothetical protein
MLFGPPHTHPCGPLMHQSVRPEQTGGVLRGSRVATDRTVVVVVVVVDVCDGGRGGGGGGGGGGRSLAASTYVPTCPNPGTIARAFCFRMDTNRRPPLYLGADAVSGVAPPVDVGSALTTSRACRCRAEWVPSIHKVQQAEHEQRTSTSLHTRTDMTAPTGSAAF